MPPSTSSLMLAALRVRDWMLSLLSAIVLLLAVFWTSAFIYGSFYFAYVPSRQSYSFPAHFAFEMCDDLRLRCSFPAAEVSLGEEGLLLGQKYSVSLELEVPDSEANRMAGMFLACATIVRRGDAGDRPGAGTASYSSCRTVLPRHRSTVTRAVEDLMTVPLYFLGAAGTGEVVTAEFFRDFVDDPLLPASGVRLEVRSVDVDFYRATLRVHAHFVGLRALMFYHPVLASCLGVGTISTVVFTALYFFWRRLFEPQVVVSLRDRVRSEPTLEERQERARELLSRSSSQQKVIKKVSDSLMKQCLQQEDEDDGDEAEVEGLRMGLDFGPGDNAARKRWTAQTK